MERRAPSNRLVIGIGNPLRGDDGVGALLAEAVGGRSVQQLTPELAEALACQQAVLFIDAWLAPAGAAPQLVEVLPAAAALDSHRLEPAQLLAVCRVLYGSSPRAHLLQVPAHAFAHGMDLSPALAATLPAARALLQAWLAAASSSDA
ncbi:MAG: hydrogenase maturation protease [Chitinophagaceae bacterium]|jgi:hydrogenase maturation protease|nr:hydrogenase maturation protease [Chitinophagaceae bacterium]